MQATLGLHRISLFGPDNLFPISQNVSQFFTMFNNVSQCLTMSHNLSQCLTIFNNVLTICLTMLCMGSKSCQLALFNSHIDTSVRLTSLNTPEFSSPLWCNSATAQFVAVFVYNFVVVLVCTLVDILCVSWWIFWCVSW